MATSRFWTASLLEMTTPYAPDPTVRMYEYRLSIVKVSFPALNLWTSTDARLVGPDVNADVTAADDEETEVGMRSATALEATPLAADGPTPEDEDEAEEEEDEEDVASFSDMTTSIPTSESSEWSSVMEYELVAAAVDAVPSVWLSPSSLLWFCFGLQTLL